MSSNEKERNSHSRGHGPMRVSEKPKDFMGSIKKLMKSLSSFKVLIFIALVLAALSSILSLIAPNKLSDLTDEITKGITINTSNMKELEEDLTKNISDIGNILGINLDEKMIYRVNSSGISSEDKIKFNDTLKSISSNQELILKYFSELPDSVLDIIIGDSTYNDIYISKEDKITTIRAFSDIDVDNKKFNGISSFPDSMKKALFPDTVIDGIEISTDDKVKFITLMVVTVLQLMRCIRLWRIFLLVCRRLLDLRWIWIRLRVLLYYLLVYILLVLYLVMLKVYL